MNASLAPDRVLLRGKRILLLEEDDLLYRALNDSLQDVGCEVLGWCERVCGALDTVPGSHLDAALIDLDPRSGGRAASIARRLHDRGVPLVLITRQLCTDASLGLQPYGSLLKPFTEQELFDRIERAVDRFPGPPARSHES